MSQTDWVGQNEKMRHLMRSVQAGRIVHALLFTGPHGTGKHTAARWLAASMLCTGTNKPCGVCPACKKLAAGKHMDVHVVSPDDRGTIRVDAIRGLIEALSLRPYEAPRHIAIIESAHRMNANAQNALLKTLESPVGDVVFILLAETTSGLLDTILSRCRVLRFAPLSVEACAQVLRDRGVPQEQAAALAGEAQGSVGRALELIEDEQWRELSRRVVRSLETLNGSDSVCAAAALIADDKDASGDVFSIMELWARDLMALQNGAEPFEQAQRDRLKRCTLDGAQLLRALMEARRRLEANVSWIHVIETMYFGLVDK